jgi:hypothetical protein
MSQPQIGRRHPFARVGARLPRDMVPAPLGPIGRARKLIRTIGRAARESGAHAAAHASNAKHRGTHATSTWMTRAATANLNLLQSGQPTPAARHLVGARPRSEIRNQTGSPETYTALVVARRSADLARSNQRGTAKALEDVDE